MSKSGGANKGMRTNTVFISFCADEVQFNGKSHSYPVGVISLVSPGSVVRTSSTAHALSCTIWRNAPVSVVTHFIKVQTT